MIELSAWHCTGPYFMAKCHVDKEVIPYKLDCTHHRIPACTVAKSRRILHSIKDFNSVLAEAFTFFNWYADGYDGAAPDEVNKFCSKYNTHASMSVGDIAEVRTSFQISYWMCQPFGWKQILPFDERFTENVYLAMCDNYKRALVQTC